MDSKSSHVVCFPHRNTLAKAVFFACILAGLIGKSSSATALLAGFLFALLIGVPLNTKKLTSLCLSFAVMGLGSGMNISVVSQQGISSVGVTLLTIFSTFLISWFLGKSLKTSEELSLLLTSGTAICGGSAIAAISSVIKARADNTAIALGCIFLLNSLALLIFPPLGNGFGLTEQEFGLWSALAIHDTSSVVGAAMQYGALALTVATSTKLVRALWIAPLSIAIGTARRQQGSLWGLLQKQWFIVGFIVVSCIFSWVPAAFAYSGAVTSVAKRLMVVTLFLIGSSLSIENLKRVGFRPLIHSVLLWISAAIISLCVVKAGWI